jgi:hypothetical protein
VSTPYDNASLLRDLAPTPVTTRGQRATFIATTANDRGTLSPELRGYFMERRRALMTELDSLNKLLGLTTK